MTWPPQNLDFHPFARGGSVAIFATSLMHLTQAMLIFFFPLAVKATDTTSLLFVLTTLGLGRSVMVVAMVITAGLAIVGMLFKLGWIRLALFIPQHFFLGVMTIGGLYASLNGRYLDGTVVSWAHILTDQLPIVALFIVHSSAIIRRSQDPNG